MQLYKILLILFLSLSFMGCEKNNNTTTDVNNTVALGGDNIPYKLLFEGYVDINNSSDKSFRYLLDQEDLNRTYANIDSGITPEIDFDNNAVFALSLGNRNSKEYSIEITTIEYKSLYLSISLETTTLHESCIKDKENTSYLTLISFLGSKYYELMIDETVKIKNCDSIDIDETYHDIDFREIDLMSISGYLGSDGVKRVEVIQDISTYKNLYYNHINPVGYDKTLPDVDLENETLLALFMGSQSTTGYELEVTSVKEYESYVEVKIKNTLVGYNCSAGDAITSPAIFVAIPKTDKEIIFKDYVSSENCR